MKQIGSFLGYITALLAELLIRLSRHDNERPDPNQHAVIL